MRRPVPGIEFTPMPDDYECAEQPVTPLPKGARRPMIGAKLKARYADGKWRPLERMAEKLEVDLEHLRATLDRMTWRNVTYYGCKAEKKRVGSEIQYRIYKLDKAISVTELVEKLAPILQGLEEESRKNMTTMSVAKVAVLHGQLRKLLREWSE